MSTYQPGDEVTIGAETVILSTWKGRTGIRWSWVIPRIDEGGEAYYATPEEAIANAARTLSAPCCDHGQPTNLFCIDCHDSVDTNESVTAAPTHGNLYPVPRHLEAPTVTDLRIFELPDHGLSSSAARRSKHWIKTLTGVDREKQDGYAFLGQFHRFDETVEMPVGTFLLSYVEDVSGSRLYGRTVTLYRVSAGVTPLQVVQHWDLDSGRGWALKVRDQISDLIASTPAPVPPPEVLAWTPHPADVRQAHDVIEAVADQLGEFSVQVDADLKAVLELFNKMLGEG